MTINLDSPQKLSQLEAINLILNTYGQREVASTGSNALAASAETHLYRALVALCMKGYHFSYSREEKWEPDVNGEILISAANIVDFHTVYSSVDLDVVNQGGKLYNRADNTFVFETPVYLAVTRTTAYDDLPGSASWFIAISAAITFMEQHKAGDPALRSLESARALALVVLEQADARHHGTLVDENPHFYKQRGRARSRGRQL